MPGYIQSDLRSFLIESDLAGLTLYIDKPVDVATQVGALCSETTRRTVFRRLKGFDGFRLTDGLTRFRDTQALALGLGREKSEKVMTDCLGLLSHGPRTSVSIDDAPIKEIVWTSEEANLSRLPILVPTEGFDLPHSNIKAEHFHVPPISGGMAVTSHPDGTQNTFYSHMLTARSFR